MTNLKEINFGVNQFCGPAVMSAITGKSTDECAAVISSINGQREIRAVHMSDLVKAFEKLRFTCVKQPVRAFSLYGALTGLANQDGFYIVCVPKHVVAVEVKENKIYLVDNHSKQPLPAESSARLIQRVDLIYKVVEKFAPKLIRKEITVMESNKTIFIDSLSIYENIEDNVAHRLGQFRYTDDKELHMILDELLERLRPR